MTSVLKKCGSCKKSGNELIECTGCHFKYYCNEICQRDHYGIHRKACEKVRNTKLENDKAGMLFMKLAYDFAQDILNDESKITDLVSQLESDGCSSCVVIVLSTDPKKLDVEIHCLDVNLYCELRKLDLEIMKSKIKTLIPVTITTSIRPGGISDENFTFYMEKNFNAQ